MNTIKPIKCGWKWLEKVVNDLIGAVNARTIAVSVGGGLDIQESPNGYILSIPVGTAAPGATAGGSSATPAAPSGLVPIWQLINVVIETDTGYVTKQTYVWSTPLQ